MDVSWGMRHKVQWATQTGERDKHAMAIMKPMGTISARVNFKRKLVRNQDGVEVISDTQVHVTDPVKVDDIVTINGQEHTVISVSDGLALYGAKASFYILYL